MKRLPSLVAVAALCFGSLPLFASQAVAPRRASVARVLSTQTSTQAIDFSAEVPAVARLQGTAFFRTSIDINNNTSSDTPITASYQFAYTCLSTACSPVGGFQYTAPQELTLPALGNFHADDIVDFLNNAGLLIPGAEQGALGTLLVTFSNVTPFGSPNGCACPAPPCFLGSEATVVARTYNHLDESTPTSATVGFAYNASLFFESTDTTLVGTARDTKTSPSVAGTLRSNIGIHNTDANNTGENVTVTLSFYDVVTGDKVGSNITLSALQPGELRQVADVWASAGIPSTVNQIVVFADATPGGATFEGYVVILDGGAATGGPTQGIATQDGSYFEMKCAAADCGN